MARVLKVEKNNEDKAIEVVMDVDCKIFHFRNINGKTSITSSEKGKPPNWEISEAFATASAILKK